jgi:hypothetical protein
MRSLGNHETENKTLDQLVDNTVKLRELLASQL